MIPLDLDLDVERMVFLSRGAERIHVPAARGEYR
jgi:hypothetical protein